MQRNRLEIWNVPRNSYVQLFGMKTLLRIGILLQVWSGWESPGIQIEIYLFRGKVELKTTYSFPVQKGLSDHDYHHPLPPPHSQYLGPISQMSPLLLSAQPEIISNLIFLHIVSNIPSWKVRRKSVKSWRITIDFISPNLGALKA